MKTATARKAKVRTVQEWIALRKIELRRVENAVDKSKASIFVVPRRKGAAQQLELGFGKPQRVEGKR